MVKPLEHTKMCFNYLFSKCHRNRRQQRFQRATRPVSFPGPRSRHGSLVDNSTDPPSTHGGSLSFKPPRQGSMCDDDQLPIDGFTYRHMVQDVTSVKTMLLKLKRVIQDEEFQGQSLKNGFKCNSQPNSPYDDSNKLNFAALLEAEEGLRKPGGIDDVIKENVELKQQNQSLQHQLEEQERTIKLLQQQMTKYACGYSEPGGRAYTHATTQTDKMSGFYKSTGSYRTACVRRTSSSSSYQAPPRFRTEFRASGRSTSSITANDEVFLDQMSIYDNDDDLDLLMEEVSLGSDLGSNADISSQFGSVRSSVTSPISMGVHGESSFTPTRRDRSLSHGDSSEHYSSQRRSGSRDTNSRCRMRSQRSVSETDSFIHERSDSRSYPGVHNPMITGSIDTSSQVPISSESTKDSSILGSGPQTDSQTQNTNSNNMAGLPSPSQKANDPTIQSSSSPRSLDLDPDNGKLESAAMRSPSAISLRQSPDGSTSASTRSPCQSSLVSGGASRHTDVLSQLAQPLPGRIDELRSDAESGFGTGDHEEMLAMRESLSGNLTRTGTSSVAPKAPDIKDQGDHVPQDLNGNKYSAPGDVVRCRDVQNRSAESEHSPPKHTLTKQNRLVSSDTVDKPIVSTSDINRNTLTKYHSVPSDPRAQQTNIGREQPKTFGNKLPPPKSTQSAARKPGVPHAASAEGGYNYLKPPVQTSRAPGSKTFGPSHRTKDTTSRVPPTSGLRKPQVSLDSQESLTAKKRRQLPTQPEAQFYGASGTRLPRPPFSDMRANTAQAGASIESRVHKTVRGRPYSKT